MKLIDFFFGQVIRKRDTDFLNSGMRSSDVQTHIDLTDSMGGVINGLDVFKSIDSSAVLITPGAFYSKGEFNEKNNLGGGERANVYTTQSFTGLPQTTPIANKPSYLLVYVKVATVNTNPDPTKLQTTVVSKNIQTGENVAIQQYPVGVIVVSNPILKSEIGKFNGVPLALLQVDYDGTTKTSSNGSIQSIDVSVKQNYIVGGGIDIVNQQIIPTAIPDNFITNRMIGNDSITGDKFLTGTIHSSAIAPYDGGLNIATSGDGIATDHLKDGAVTSDKLGFSDSLSNFNSRNYLLNASFEDDIASPVNWNSTGTSGFLIDIETNAITTLFGLRSARLKGASSSGIPTSQLLSQKIDFKGPINGQPITPYFYARPFNDFNLSEIGTNGINGVLEFFGSFGDTTPISTIIFSSYSGTTVSDNGGYIKLEPTQPIIIPTTSDQIKSIAFSISGTFSNTVNVDGAFIGLTAQSPKFDVNLNEQINNSINISNVTQGQLDGQFLANGAVTTSKIRVSDGSVTTDPGFGIRTDQIRDLAVTASKIADHTITNQQLAAGVSAVPTGAVLIFLTRDSSTLSDPVAKGCPTGFRYRAEFEGRFPIGVNPLATSVPLINPGNQIGTPAAGDGSTNPPLGNTRVIGGHRHNIAGGSGGTGLNLGVGTSASFDTSTATLPAIPLQIPAETVIFCEKI